MSESNLKKQWNKVSTTGDPLVGERIWRRISRRIDKKYPFVVSTVAAAILLLIGLFGWNLSRNSVTESPKETPQQFIVGASKGTHTKVALPDGTSVIINAGSSLSYTSEFNKVSRDVFLEGEAYFDVASNPDIPFRVLTTGCSFSVFGTKFNISAYPDDEFVRGTLLEGSLRFESDKGEQLLVPGQEITFEEGHYSLQEVDASQSCSWINGDIKYDSIPFSELCRRISRVYDVEVVLDVDELARKKIRVSFSKEDSITTIIKTLEVILPIQIKQEGSVIYINEKD